MTHLVVENLKMLYLCNDPDCDTVTNSSRSCPVCHSGVHPLVSFLQRKRPEEGKAAMKPKVCKECGQVIPQPEGRLICSQCGLPILRGSGGWTHGGDGRPRQSPDGHHRAD